VLPRHRIDLATERDVPRIVDISNWAALHTPANFATRPEPLEPWAEAWRRTCAQHPWLVARGEDGTVVGFAKSGPHRGRCAYDWTAELTVYLDPSVHGRGLGTALYGALIPILDAQGYVTLLAGITSGHEPSERLHARMGFVRCATYHRVGWKFGRWWDVGYWERHLRGADHVPGPVRAVADVFPVSPVSPA
jgi:phosphinothricin acetyltransferase